MSEFVRKTKQVLQSNSLDINFKTIICEKCLELTSQYLIIVNSAYLSMARDQFALELLIVNFFLVFRLFGHFSKTVSFCARMSLSFIKEY